MLSTLTQESQVSNNRPVRCEASGIQWWIPVESSVVCHCCSLLWGRKTHKDISGLKNT